MSDNPQLYSIPAKHRKTENLHIGFWLIKDMSRAMLWKPLGLFMIIPTIGAALLITWQTKHIKSELLHNLAVDFWIVANACWMLTEFYSANDTLRFYTIIPFRKSIAEVEEFENRQPVTEAKSMKNVEV